MLFKILDRLKNENFYWNIGFYALIVAGLTHVFFFFLFIFLDIPQLVVINVISIAIYLYCIFGLSLKTLDTKDDSQIGWFVFVELIGHSIIATYYLGLESGFQYYMYTIIFIPFFIWTYTTVVRLLRIVIVITVALLLEYWGYNHPPVIRLSPEYSLSLHYMNLFLLLIIMAFISYFYSIYANMYQNLLFKQSNVDPLTNLYNRRYVHEVAENDTISFKREGSHFGLLLIDIDYFKKINDRYGHKCGDKVLIELSHILNENVRQTTIVSRWGGEEFLIVLEDTYEDELIHLGERLRSVIENTVLIKEKKIQITVTIGGAVSHQDESIDEVLSRADKALYQGKEKGRNQVLIDS